MVNMGYDGDVSDIIDNVASFKIPKKYPNNVIKENREYLLNKKLNLFQ